jgi:[acyl-carrier-protein] S-malonyltransferase
VRRSDSGQSRYAFLFPGQGSQHIGMGVDLIAADSPLTRLLRRVEQLTGHRLEDAMLLGPEERLNETVTTQLSVFVLSVALAEALAERGVRPSLVAGHSLGEFSALVVGGWLDVDAAIVAVAARAEAMTACCSEIPGAMSAVIGVPAETIDVLAARLGVAAAIANYNSPRQSVIAGEREAVEALGRATLAAGAAAVIPLSVAGAFHSPLMTPAKITFAPVVASIPLRLGEVPLISSVTGATVTDLDAYRIMLAEQITAPVRWNAVMGVLRDAGVLALTEVGPGRALRGLFRHVDRSLRVRSCDGLAACEELKHVPQIA